MSEVTYRSPPTRGLENRIPPPAVLLLVGGAMGALGWSSPIAGGDTWRLVTAGFIALSGLAVFASGLVAFRRAKTTIDPVRVDTASSLVTGGIYRFTRNPMYVGFTALLVGWAVFLAEPLTFLGPLAFVLFTTRFQIVPEERAMRAKFGQSYDEYAARVRRWL